MNWKKVRETTLIGILLILVYFGLQNPKSITGLVGTFLSLLSPFFLGLVFAFLLMQPYHFFETKIFDGMQNSKKPMIRKAFAPLCVLSTYLSLAAVLTLLGSFVVPQVALSISQVTSRSTVFVTNLQVWLTNLDVSRLLPPEIQASVNQWLSGLAAQLLNSLPRLLNAAPQLTGMVKAFGGGVFNIFIALVASLYLMLEKDRLLSQLSRLNRAFIPRYAANRLARAGEVTAHTFRCYVNGQLLDALIVGLVSITGLSILQFPYAVLVGTLMGVTNVIPFFGPFIGAVPGFLIIATADPVKALWYVVFVVVIQQIDGNFIVPRIVGDSIGLPPFWVLVSVTVGGGLMGIWGMVLGMPLFAAAYKLLGEATRRRESAAVPAPSDGGSPVLDGGSPASDATDGGAPAADEA